MRRIWKYALPYCGRAVLYLPKGTRLLSVGRQRDIGSEFGNSLFLWAEVDSEQDADCVWDICVLMTGDQVSWRGFAGTVTLRDDPPFVVHVYIDKPDSEEAKP